ncbi:MAG: hypothetical protein R3F56_21340 [Planctomycetota bacterium]
MRFLVESAAAAVLALALSATLPAQAPCIFGSPHVALGNAQLTVNGPGASLTVANVGSSGLDGVRVDHDHSKAFYMNWSPLGSATGTPTGASLTLGASGVYSSSGCGPLGTVDVTDSGSMLAVHADFTAIGSPTQRVDAYLDGQLQASVRGATGVLATMRIWPDGSSYQLASISPTRTAGLWFTWNTGVQIGMPNGGPMVVADELAILTEGYTSATSVQSLEVTLKSLPDLTVQRERVLRDSGAPGILGMPNGVTLDVQAIVAQATGVSYSGMMGVEVDDAGHFYVSARRATPTGPHVLLELDAAGAYVATYPLPAATSASTAGMGDLAYDGRYVYGGMEKTAGPIYAFDTVTKTFDPAKAIPTAALPGIGVQALGFVPDKPNAPVAFLASELGNPSADLYLFDRQGVVLETIPNPGLAVLGIAYRGEDRAWLWCQGGSGHPAQVVAVELDTARGVLTGVRVIGDTTLAGQVPGGIAGGAAFHRRNGVATLLVLAQANSDTVYEMSGSLQYGRSCGPQIGLFGDAPYAGNQGFSVAWTAAGASGHPVAAAFLVGPGAASIPLGLPLAARGCALDLNGILLSVPVAGVGCAGSLSLPLPAGTGGVFLHCQWATLPATGLPALFSDGGAFVIRP